MRGMPAVMGLVDGTLIKLDGAPMRDDELAYADRTRGHSLNVMVVCGPKKEFFDVFADFPGRAHDTRVLRQSPMFERLQNGPRKMRVRCRL
jgi:hypothetical protein